MQYRFGGESFNILQGWLQTTTYTKLDELAAVVVGFLVAAGLQGLRVLFPAFPLHPLAYAVTSSYQINLVWFPLTIACIVKWSLLRFGGHKVFRQSLPFFIGLILGQFVVGGLWNIFGTLTNTPTYRFWD